MTISFFEFFIIVVIGQCIFLIFAIQYIPKKHTGANKILQYLLAIYSFYLLERVLISEVCGHFMFKFGYARNTFYYCIGPLVYTYVRRLLFSKNANFRLGFFHFLPAMLYFTYSIVHIFIYDSVTDPKQYRYFLLYAIELSCFVSISTYLLKSIALLYYYEKNEKRELSFRQTIVRYVKIMLLFLSFYMLCWFLGILERFLVELPVDFQMIYDVSCVIFGIQIYFVGFYSLKHPEVLKIPFRDAARKTLTNRPKLSKSECEEIEQKVDYFLKVSKGYLHTNLSLSVLASEIPTTTNKLSWVLNNGYKKTFYQLVNEYRVKDFLERVQENQHKEFTVVSIALDVGFKSKSTFYKAFKEITNYTPTEYIRDLESKGLNKTVVDGASANALKE